MEFSSNNSPQKKGKHFGISVDKKNQVIIEVKGKKYTFDKVTPLLKDIVKYESEISAALENIRHEPDRDILKISAHDNVDILEILIPFLKSGNEEDEKCCICLCEFIDNLKDMTIDWLILALNELPVGEIVRLEKCDGHFFHTECLKNYIKQNSDSYIKCPICCMIYGTMQGDELNGKMNITKIKQSCKGYEGYDTIVIDYYFPNGKKKDGTPYTGTSRRAYLPDTKEGNEVLRLLKIAFERNLSFAVGTSVTTGQKNTVVWNGIHHKTNISGGSSNFGYPDATYLSRVKEELASKGIF